MGCLIFALLIYTSAVWAGDINGDEARVVAAASGTFTYDGKTYKAYSSYVSEEQEHHSQVCLVLYLDCLLDRSSSLHDEMPTLDMIK